MKIHDEEYQARFILFLHCQGPVTFSGPIASERYYQTKEMEFREKLKKDGELCANVQTIHCGKI